MKSNLNMEAIMGQIKEHLLPTIDSGANGNIHHYNRVWEKIQAWALRPPNKEVEDRCSCAQGVGLCDATICIIDFAGNYKYRGFWADWCPHTKKVYFGGFWAMVPTLDASNAPTPETIEAYVNKFNLGGGLK